MRRGQKEDQISPFSVSNGITVLMDKAGISENKPKSMEMISEKTKIA